MDEFVNGCVPHLQKIADLPPALFQDILKVMRKQAVLTDPDVAPDATPDLEPSALPGKAELQLRWTHRCL